LFSWNLLLMIRQMDPEFVVLMFQSLFSWNLLLMSPSVDRDPHDRFVSILVFVELALDAGSKIFCASDTRTRFQSLFSWNLLLMKFFSFDHKHLSSFNPCFRGTCSWCCLVTEMHTDENSFNPCFRGTCSWCSEEHDGYSQRLVSILVFVELALDDRVPRGHHMALVVVSILVFVELALDVIIKFAVRCRRQHVSILVFVELALDDMSYDTDVTISVCFNPCFRGTCSWCIVKALAIIGKIQVSILVFVELALDVLDYTLLGKLRQRFNPCFRGTCSWWPGQLCLIRRILQFQSLFSWNLLLMPQRSLVHQLANEFQSLFSWNLLLMEKLDGVSKFFGESFNPCFRGTCSWWICPYHNMVDGSRVSILVFVELALDVYIVNRIADEDPSFNPCFRGTCSWWTTIPHISQVAEYRASFNPCFRGTCSW